MHILKIKSLVKKFSYNELQEEAKKQGWLIPLISQLKGHIIDHDLIWVADQTDTQDSNTHGYIYRVSTGVKMIANHGNIYNVVIIVKPKKCPHCQEVL